MEELALLNPGFWVPVLQIVAIDLLLGGDNAIVIALACRNLPPAVRRRGIFWGTAAAIGLRAGLTVFAVSLLDVPYLKLAGALLLLWIGVKLIVAEDEEPGREVRASDRLAGAIRTIVLADVVMSLDNVLAVAAAARGSGALIVFGLALSIPIIVLGSGLVMRLVERFPFVVVLGGGLLGWIALGMAVSDVAVHDWVQRYASGAARAAPPAGAVAVMAVGALIARRRSRLADLASRERRNEPRGTARHPAHRAPRR